MNRRFPEVAWPALAFSLWSCRDLIVVWRHSPLDRFEWLAFLIWIVPIGLYWRHGRPPAYRSITVLLGIGLAFTLAGILGETNTARHLGLIAILAAFGSHVRLAPLWWIAGISWIPLLTMIALKLAPSDFPKPILYALRLTLATLGTLAVLLPGRFNQPGPSNPAPTPSP